MPIKKVHKKGKVGYKFGVSGKEYFGINALVLC